jgi:D-arabinose 5-phosphate isomerase GutQ
MLGRTSALHNDAPRLWGGDLLVALSKSVNLDLLK